MSEPTAQAAANAVDARHIHPEPELLPRRYYPVDEWRLVETRFSAELLARTETLFATSNGYLGMRGNLDEGRPFHEHGTYVAGFHETWPIQHAESAFGLAEVGQTIVNVPDSQLIKLYVDDEPLYLPVAEVRDYERALDLRSGILERRLLWETASGKEVEVRSRRLVSMEHRHLAVYDYQVRVLNGDAPIIISSHLVNREDADAPDETLDPGDPRATRAFAERVLQQRERRVDDQRIIFGFETSASGMTLACGVDHVFETTCDHRAVVDANRDSGKVVYIIQAKAGATIRLTKYATYHTSHTVPSRELVDRAERVLHRGRALGLDELVASQERFVAAFWDRADVVVEDQPEIQQAVRWNLFQLLQATARAEGSGVPAKGLTGSGYEGHYFWDIELFVIPFLNHTEPRIAKNLLRYRHSLLDKARARAAELSHRGALYPWRTITGEEASAYYAAGTAQYHINADIVHAMKRYVQVTGDDTLLRDGGAEVLLETARLWVSLGFYGHDGAFHLHSVTGPDEYTTVVNDNAYTNMMARMNLRYAAEVIARLRVIDPARVAALGSELGLREDEPEEWRRAADAMFVPWDAERRIHPQDAHFLERAVWDFANTPADRYPLLLHYHPLMIYRHQVIKQADVVLAMFLLDEEFSPEQRRRNYRYYDPLTTSDSSLSPPVHAIVGADVDDLDRALAHFRRSLYMDLADVASNAHQGVHVASTGGVWLALVSGFGGMREREGGVSFDPHLPTDWPRLRFPLLVRGRRFDVAITHDDITFRLREGDPLTVQVRGADVVMEAGRDVTVPLGSEVAA